MSSSGMQMPQESLFGLSIQQEGAGTDYEKMARGYDEPSTANFSYFPLMDSNVGFVKMQDRLPDEIGGKALSLGSFVTGVWGEGTASLIARLENRLGWVLLAAMGSCSSIGDTTIANYLLGSSGSDSDINTHVFTFPTEAEFFAPWLTVRRLLPHVQSAEQVGEILQDARLSMMTMNAAAGAPVGLDLAILGRRLQEGNEFDFEPGWTATYDDFRTFAVATCDGHFKIGDTEMEVTNVTVNVAGNPLPPMQSVTIGNIDPKDFPILSREVTVTATVLLEDYDFYVSTLAGEAVDVSGSAGTTAECTVYKGDLDVMLASQINIGATSEPYRLRILTHGTEDNVAWQVQPIRTVPRQPIVLQVIGTVEAVTAGSAVRLLMQNGQANYELP